MTITAAADGSALGNPGPAGWAWYIDEDTWRAGGWPHGTNNMGELKAVLDLLEATAADPASAGQQLHILCDSQYVINSVTKWMPGWKRKGWKKRDGKPVQNVDLMKAIDGAMAGRDVTFEWVKGHAGHPMNEAADTRANGAATAFSRGKAPDAGPGLSGHAPSAPDATDSPDTTDTTDTPRTVDTSASAGSAADREIALYTDDVRGDPAMAAGLLHPGLTVVDATGTRLDHDGFLASLKPLRGFNRLDLSDIVSEELSPGVELVTSTATGPYGTTYRVSVWVERDGVPVLRHHQQTPVT
ncbi:MAG: RNase H family protein [Mycobacteriaceae bacterium]|uniref:RNase H family protein n=1 Tax=Corynebacterium sp. TaxID=1720 RepID=UPI003F9A5C66